MEKQTWRANEYNTHASFVSTLALPVVGLLDPRAGETILDLGCGDGTLAVEIEKSGAHVVGVDSSPSMVAAARSKGVEAYVINGARLPFNEMFNAVFTNAALHWMLEADDVVAGVAKALKTGGRFVGEFGGYGNINHLVTAMEAEFKKHPEFGEFKNPWFFPREAQYQKILESHGFDVESIALIPRPTPLKTGVQEWLTIFADHAVSGLTPVQRELFLAGTEERVRPSLFDPQNGWTADYVRLRFQAVKRS
jgi:2-isopropylmalate synthase